MSVFSWRLANHYGAKVLFYSISYTFKEHCKGWGVSMPHKLKAWASQSLEAHPNNRDHQAPSTPNIWYWACHYKY